MDGEGVYPSRMPSEGPYALPFEGPQVDRPVARATDDGILVDGEGVYPTPMPIAALGHRTNEKGKKRHVPYRNSKLTWLLSNSLNGNSKFLMLVCVSPTLMCTNESMCSLQFAQRCRATKLGMAKKVV